MNDDKNNPEPQPWIDPALEARVVAAVLGETSAFEAAELERAVAENPELAIFQRRIEAVHALVGTAVRPENPKIQLSPERRRKLLETIGVSPVKPPTKVRVFALPRPAWWTTPLLIRLAASLIMGAIFVTFLSSVVVFKSSRVPADFVAEGSAQGGFISADVSNMSAPVATSLSASASLVSSGIVMEATPAAQVPMPMAMPAEPKLEQRQAELAAATTSEVSEAVQPQQMAQLESSMVSFETIPHPAGTPVVGKDMPVATATAIRGFTGGFGKGSGRGAGTRSKEQDSVTPQSAALNEAQAANGLSSDFAGDRAELPQVTTRSGQSATLQTAREFPYPSEFAPPQAAQAQVSAAWEDKKSNQPAEKLKDADAGKSEAAQYLAGAPEAEGTQSAGSLGAGWDSVYMFRGVNVLQSEKPQAADDQSEKIIIEGMPPSTSGPVTGGKRSASSAISANGVDTLLFSAPPESAPSKETEVTANVINQPIFSSRDGKVEFEGFINYGSPITTAVPMDAEKAGQAEQLLEEAQGFYSTGRYDLASKRYEQTLDVDPYNVEARRGMEQVNQEHSKYAASAFDESRSRSLLLADRAWERPVRRFQAGASTIIEQPQIDTRGTATISRKLQDIIIPRIDFKDATVREAVDFLKQRAASLDTAEQDPSRKGVNIALKLPPDAAAAQAKIDLSLTNVSLLEALRYVTELSGLKYKVEPYAVALVPLSESVTDMITKEYPVPPGFIPASPASGTRMGTKNFLEAAGVPFPAGASANHLASSNKLIVKNTASNLDLIDAMVENQNGRDGSASRPSTAVSSKPPYQANEIPTAKQPFSTFSLHVSDVSFQLAKDALAKGTMPDPARIRAEEFYNAFDYNDPSPAPGEEVACRIEQAAHPFLQQRDLVRIALKVAAAGRAAGQPLRLTLLLDTSGSMEREDRAVSVRRALETLATLLGPQDRVTLIGFARTPRLLAEQVPGDQAGKLVEIADRTPSEGGTNLEEALALASELAFKQKLPAAQNRIVLLTDGAANLGNANPVRLAQQIEKTRQQGISFDACGVGANGLNDEMLEALTRKGDGRYYFLNKPGDADAGFARQLAGALRPAAENVKVQVVFNPTRVSQYRLIGFEKHLLKKEDFRNDKVQAAELSAEEAGVALYQVQTLPEGEGELGQVFVRFRDPASGSMVERSWTMPYDAQARAFDQASPSLQLAATAALLAEKLRGDAQVDLNALGPVINTLRGHYPNQERVGDLIQMFERMRP